jgi:1,4-alpha-glucan branching enzyme
LLPQIPMLFMGEEWGAVQPFPFFCDFGSELADAVRKGRRDEFARFPEFADPKTRERIPDPMAEETFASAKLRWEDIEREPHAGWLDWYRRVLATRHAEIVPDLAVIRAAGRYRVLGEGAVIVRWQLGERGVLLLAANLADTSAPGFPNGSGRVLWQEGEAGEDGIFGPWTVRWSIDKDARGQRGNDALDELAEQRGIEPQFRDAKGEIAHTDAATGEAARQR